MDDNIFNNNNTTLMSEGGRGERGGGYVGESIFSDQEATAISYLHYISAPLSVAGSFIIIRSIVQNRQPNLRGPFRRLMLGISVSDMITSLAWICLSPWAAPSSATDSVQQVVAGAHGNFATCSLMGFLIHFQVGAGLYNAFLSLYFLLQVRFEMRPERFAKYIEPWFHFIAISVPLGTGIYAIANQFINPILNVPGTCWINDYPSGCNLESSQVACIRGGGLDYDVFNRVLGIGTIGMSFLVIFVSMTMLVVKVYQTELRMRRYDASRSPVATLSGLKRTRAVAVQALLYMGAYLLSAFPVVLLQMYTADGGNKRTYTFASSILLRLLNPLFGFFSAMVYLRKTGGDGNRTRPRRSGEDSSEIQGGSRLNHIISFPRRMLVALATPKGKATGNETTVTNFETTEFPVEER